MQILESEELFDKISRMSFNDWDNARLRWERKYNAWHEWTTTLNDGRQALNFLLNMLEEGKDPSKELLMIISDIEDPNKKAEIDDKLKIEEIEIGK